ncbi:MAG: LPS export ABC transporter ATP-binding protein [Gammaproteobacteria bacterium]
MSVLSAEHLAKAYRSRQVVKDVSVVVSSGEIVGLLGPNGAGKTTSFLMLVGLIPADGGKVTLDRVDITHLGIDRRARMGVSYLPQESSIFRGLTVEQNILAVLETLPELSQAARHQRLEQLLEQFKLGHLRQQQGVNLSGGERRRTEIARALGRQPRFLLLDEPFAGIDPISLFDLQRVVRHLRKWGIGVLITDHNVRETLKICDRAYIVIDGKTVMDGPPKVILQHQRVRDDYLGEEFTL